MTHTNDEADPGARRSAPTAGASAAGAPGVETGDVAAAEACAGPSGEPAGGPTRGADMARAALEAARARNAGGRTDGRRGRVGSRAGGRLGIGGEADVRRLLRRRWSGPGDDRARDPQRLGDTLSRWVARTDTAGDVIKARLFTQWSAIVGAEIADHAQPTALQDRELLVQADSTAWATQLRLLAPGMVKRINQALGHGTVIRIRTKGPTAPSWRFGNRHVPGRGPRDTYG